MAGDGTTFDIDIAVRGATATTAAADAVTGLSRSLEAAIISATAAADAVLAGEAAFKAAETSANRAALAVEKIGIQADAQRGKLRAAMDAGDVKGAERAAEKLQALVARQGEAATKATAATAALNAEAVALDRVKAAAAGAAANHTAIERALEAARNKADAASRAFRQSADAFDPGKASKKIAALGGSLGQMAGTAFEAADGLKTISSSLGGAGPYVAVAVGIAAIVAGVAAVSAAAVIGVGSITMWAVKLADTTGEIPKIQKRATDGFKKIFSGLKIGPLLSALDKMAGLFDEGSASANAMKAVFESLFQPIVDGITAFVPKMVSAFIQFEILVLKAMISIKPFGSTILTVAKVLGIVALVVTGVLAVAIGVLIAGVAAMAVGFTAAVAVVAALVAGFVWLGLKSGELGMFIIEGVGKGIEWLKGLSLAEIGTALIDGLVNGLKAGAGAVLGAITGIATGAVDAAKSALGIASPSKIFAEIGMNTAAGMSEGVDTGAGAVAGSLEAMVAPPEATAAGTPASSGGTASGGGAGALYTITINAGAAGEAIAEALRKVLADIATEATGGTPSAA